MPDLTRLTSADDPRVADYRTLKDTELRKRYEHRVGVFVAEGPNVVAELVRSPYPVRSVLVDERRVEAMQPVLDAVDAPVYVVERDLLYAIVTFRMHQGVVAIGGRLPARDPAEVVAGAARVLVLDAMNDHENMGAIFRTARALGVDAVLLGPRSADPLYRRCVRVSMGHVLHVPFAEVPALPGGYDLLRREGLATVALTPDPSVPTLAEVDRGARLALVLGAEGDGLDPEAIAAADVRARIEQSAEVDSLNVSVTAGIALHGLRPTG